VRVGAGDDHLAGLERLAEAVQRLGRELGELVEEEDPIVRQRGLARPGLEAAAGQGGHAGGVMRGAERPGAGQGALGDQARHRMDHRGLEQLLGGERRQKSRQPLGQHRLARARRAGEQEIVAARRGDLQRSLGALLTLDVAQVRAGGALEHRPGPGRAQHLDAAEVVNQRDQGAGRQDRRVPGPGRLRPVRLGADQAEAHGLGRHRRGQHAGHRGDAAVQGKLADRRPAIQGVGRHHPHGGQHAQGDRQVVVAAFLGQVGRRQIDHDAAAGQRQAEAGEGAAHPLAALAHGLVAEADDDGAGLAVGELNLHLDAPGLHALERDGDDPGDHPNLQLPPPSPSPRAPSRTKAELVDRRKSSDHGFRHSDHVPLTGT